MLTKEEIEIINGCRKGDVTYQKMLYDKYGPMLKGVCLRYTSDMQEAEDLFHDVIVHILTHFDEYDHITTLGGWLKTITSHKAIDLWRYKKNHDAVPSSHLPIEDPMDDKEHIYDGIPMDVLLEHIQKLPPKYRTAFNLYVIEEKDQTEISKIMDEGLTNVRSLVFRAKQMLRKSIKKYLKNEEFNYE